MACNLNVKIFAAAVFGASLFSACAVIAAEPPPQVTAKDYVQTFADKPTPPANAADTPAGDCDSKDENGVCEPAKDTRGFNLPDRASLSAAKSGAKSPDAAPRTHLASRETAAASVRRHSPAARDLLITFKLGSAELTEQARANAKEFAKALATPDLASMSFEINGYTDASGDKDRNMVLSQNRAEAVKAFLISQGIDSARLTARGFGAQDLAAPEHPLSADNRRVVARKIE